MRRKNIWIVYIVLSVAAFVSIFPCYWMFISAFNTSNEIAAGKLLPGNYLIENMHNLFDKYLIVNGLVNSIKISALVVVCSLIVTSLAAYGFEKFKNKRSEKAYVVMLLGMMIPQTALMIPTYMMMAKMHLVNNHLAIILPAIGSVFLVFFFRQSFKAIPNEIIESARIDGAGELMIFFRIVFPSMKSTYAAAGVYSFMMSWNNYMWPMLMLNTDEQKTITLMVSKIASSAYVADYGMQMAGLVISTLPMMFVFLFLQRYFVDGLTGSVKG